MFEDILLESEQTELLGQLVEAARNVSRDQREKFMYIGVSGGAFIQHQGLNGHTLNVYKGDLEILGSTGMILITYGRNTFSFDVTPLGFRYYEWIKHKTTEPVSRLESEIHQYLNASRFQSNHPSAYQKWTEAEAILWSADSEKQLTTIGHLCRESLQEFAADLIERYELSTESDKSKTVARIRAVLKMQADRLGESKKAFFEALVVYWGTVSDLAQRQEHGAQKEGEKLTWADGRRLVFQTAFVIFELDQEL